MICKSVTLETQLIVFPSETKETIPRLSKQCLCYELFKTNKRIFKRILNMCITSFGHSCLTNCRKYAILMLRCKINLPRRPHVCPNLINLCCLVHRQTSAILTQMAFPLQPQSYNLYFRIQRFKRLLYDWL